ARRCQPSADIYLRDISTSSTRDGHDHDLERRRRMDRFLRTAAVCRRDGKSNGAGSAIYVCESVYNPVEYYFRRIDRGKHSCVDDLFCDAAEHYPRIQRRAKGVSTIGSNEDSWPG